MLEPTGNRVQFGTDRATGVLTSTRRFADGALALEPRGSSPLAPAEAYALADQLDAALAELAGAAQAHRSPSELPSSARPNRRWPPGWSRLRGCAGPEPSGCDDGERQAAQASAVVAGGFLEVASQQLMQADAARAASVRTELVSLPRTALVSWSRTMEPANPFVFETPLEPEDPLVGREQELARLLELARSGTYTLLEAPRRFGKTTLLKRLAHIWRTEEDRLAVWVDFSRVLTADEAARRLERAYAEYHGGRLGNLVSELLETIRIRLGPVEIGRPPHAAPDPRDRLHELLELPAEVARRSGHRVHVSFDEFQDILAIEGLDGLVRSHVQHHRKHVSYVFAGSEPSMLRELFSDRARPLYGQVEPVRLGRLEPDELGEHVARQFRRTGKDAGEGGLHVCSLGDGHPQRTMLLAWHLWDHTQTGERATRTTAEAALASALADAEGEFRAAKRGMAENTSGGSPWRSRTASPHWLVARRSWSA